MGLQLVSATRATQSAALCTSNTEGNATRNTIRCRSTSCRIAFASLIASGPGMTTAQPSDSGKKRSCSPAHATLSGENQSKYMGAGAGQLTQAFEIRSIQQCTP